MHRVGGADVARALEAEAAQVDPGEQRLAATVLDVLGPTLEHAEPDAAEEDGFWYETYLYSRAATIYGGTQQIQRNIIADRVLALPQE